MQTDTYNREILMRIRRQRGFTLVELMVAVAIVAILASIAYPSYVNHVVKSNRASAQSVLMEIAQKQSQYMLDNRGYASDLSTLHVSTPAKLTGIYTFSVTVSNTTPPGFTATATPVAGTAQASDGTLTIDNVGTKSPSSKW